MAARTLRPRHQEDIRTKIQVSQLINVLEKQALTDDAPDISASRMNTVSYGKERPAASGSDEEAWAQNRRAVTIVIRDN